MVVEMSVSDDASKRRLLELLDDLGYRASSGGVWMSHPFSIEIHDVPAHDVTTVRQLVTASDPGAVTIGIDVSPVAA